MGPETRLPARYEELVGLPEYLLGQIIDGDVIITSWPSVPEVMAHSRLLFQLSSAFMLGRDGPGEWWILPRMELHFGDDVLVPSILGWRKERMPEMPDVAYFTEVPDWVCEVIPPISEALERKRKPEIYAREGVGHLWLVDPTQGTLEVFQRQDAQWMPQGRYFGEERFRAEPFEAVAFELGTLWPPELDAPWRRSLRR
jgi:Uma2 family endonuclease